jgi:hypothetical protein
MSISRKRTRSRNARKSRKSKTRVNKRRQNKITSKKSKRVKRRPTKRIRKTKKRGGYGYAGGSKIDPAPLLRMGLKDAYDADNFGLYVDIAFNTLANPDMVLELNMRGELEDLMGNIVEKLKDIIKIDKRSEDRRVTRLISDRVNSRKIAEVARVLHEVPKGDYDLAGEYEDTIFEIKEALKKEE